MTEMPECPMCGKPITMHKEWFGTDIKVVTGCWDCGLVIPSFVSSLVYAGKYYSEDGDIPDRLKDMLVLNWEDLCRRSPHINSAKAENVLRTAYGMPQVSYLDFVERDILRRGV